MTFFDAVIGLGFRFSAVLLAVGGMGGRGCR